MMNDTFLNIQKVAKQMKCSFINIYPDRLIGIDANIIPISYVSMVYINTNTGVSKIPVLYNDLAEGRLTPIHHSMEEYIIDNFYVPAPTLLLESVILKDYGEASIPCLEGKKASDGMVRLIINNRYPISISKTLLPVTKADKCEVNIYYKDQSSFTAEFIIYKKKDKYELRKFINYLYL